ncbi:MAG: DUF2085 domain-containing protein [Bacteroidota bacterium]
MKKELNILIIFVVVWCLGLIAAPLLYDQTLSKIIYRFYSVVCHQFDSRSFHIYGKPFAVCIRCTSIYAGFLLALCFVRLIPELRSKKFNTWLLLSVFSIPMLIDGSLSMLSIINYSMLSRIITGSLFGIGMALLMHQMLTEIIHTQLFKRTNEYEHTTG